MVETGFVVMKKKTVIIVVFVVLIAPVAVVIGLWSLLQSPRAVNKLAAFVQPATGIYLYVDDIHLNRRLGGYINGLQIKQMKEKGFHLYVPTAEIKGGTTGWLTISLQNLVLTNPAGVFYLEDKSKTDPFEVLKKMPRVHLLEIKNGRLDLKKAEATYSLSGMNLTVRDFHPEGSGRFSGRTDFIITTEYMTAAGSADSILDITGFFPVPSALGSVRVVLHRGSWGQSRLENGFFTSDIKLKGDTISLDHARAAIQDVVQSANKNRLAVKDISAQCNVSYNRKTSGFSVTSLAVSGTDFGSLKGEISFTENPRIWKVSLHAFSLDIAQLYRFVKPLLPADYHGWTVKGKSTFDVTSHGRQDNGAWGWRAKAVVDLREGGFASPDGSKAAEKMTGRVILNIDTPNQNHKGAFEFSVEFAVGEVLWGTYYQDFGGKKVSVSVQGVFISKPFSISLSGTGDFFKTGTYHFAVDSSPNRKILSVEAKNISLKKIFGVVAKNYIIQNYPNWKDLEVEGGADIQMTATVGGAQKGMEGNLTLRDSALRSSSNNLVLMGLNVSLPYDLAFTGAPMTSSSSHRTGNLAFDLLEKNHIRISHFATPVVFSGNKFVLPDPITVNVFGGEIRLVRFQAENLLREDARAEANLDIQHIDIQQMMGQKAPMPLVGIINGSLPVITFQNGRWSAQGEVIAQIFGGQIKIENIVAGRLLSSTRFWGADITFNHINLEELTSSLKVGLMTGWIKGSLKNYSMEYGQPSGFDLLIETDESSKAPKLISVDAINNLSIISTGSAAISAILSSGVNQFFKDYPYSRIGMRCTLQNDIFKLQGLIHDAGKEYLVRRALFRGVDIINQNPDNYIHFKDMAERISRIRKSKKETNPVP